MKKKLKKFNVSIMLILMFFSYLTPIFNLFIVKAEDVNTNELIIDGLNEEGMLELDFDENKTKSLTVDSNLYEITSCSSWSADNESGYLKTSSNEESCTVTSTNYGIFNLYVYYKNKLTNEDGTKKILVDVNTREYLQNLIKEIPTILYGENMWDEKINTLINDILPENVRYNLINSEIIDGKRIYTNELIYTYYIYNDINPYPERFEIKEQFTTEVRDYIGIPNFYLQELNAGDEAEINFNGKTIDYEDYIFVSMDREILTVNEKGNVKALTPGKTSIRIYDKETLKYIEREVTVHGLKRSYEEVKADFPTNIEISVNGNEMFEFDNNYNVRNQEYVLRNYFINYFQENLGYQHGFNINNITLENNICTINYNYSYQGNILEINENLTFNFNFSGVYTSVNSMNTEYKNYFNYKVIGDEKISSINVDNNYLKQVYPDTDREFVKNNDSIYLGNLRVDGFALDSQFQPDYSYLSVTVPNKTDSVTVIAEPESENVTLKYYLIPQNIILENLETETLKDYEIASLENVKLNEYSEMNNSTHLVIRVINNEYNTWYYDYNLYIYKSNMDFIVYDGLKSGKTNIEIVTDKNVYSHEIYVTPKQNEVDSIKEYIDDLLTLEIPYVKYENVSKYIENYLYQKIKNELTIPNIKDEIEIDVECFYNNVCSVRLYNQHYGINYKTTTKVIFDTNSTNTKLQLINEYREQLKDEYFVSLEDTIKLENSCNGDKNCFYESLINKIEIPTINGLKVEYELVNHNDFNDLVNGNAIFNIKVLDGETKLYNKNITIFTDHVISLSSGLSDEEDDKIAYLKTEIDSILESDVTLVKLFEDVNIYEINNNGIRFNVYLDKKERIPVNGINFSTNIYSIALDEELKVEYTKWPVYANYGDIEFKSTDENIFTVSEDGVITGHNKGVAYIQAKAGYQTTYAMILVDIDLKDFLNESLNLIDKHIKVHYSDLNYSSIEDAIRNRAYQFLYDNFSYVSPQIEIIEEDEKYYLILRIWDNMTSNYIDSDRVEITYELEGIKISEYRNFISSNETVDLGIEFTEGDNNNLVIDVSDDTVVSVTNDGKVTGLKPGIVNIYINDKYYQYYNHVKVYVDYDIYYQQEMAKLKADVLELDGSKHSMSGYSMSITEKELMQNIFTNVVYEKVQLYDLVDNYEINCEADTCTLSFESLVTGEMIEEVFNVKKTGIYINEVIDNFDIGMTKTLNYNVYDADPSNVTITSLQPNVCSVEDNMVTANDKGICILHYQVLEDNEVKYSKYQGITIDPNEMTLEYHNALDNMNSNIHISLPPYVGPETEFDYDYDELYYNAIANAIKEELNMGNDYYINFDVGSLEGESNKINITIHPEAYYYNEDENFHYSIMLNSTDQKEINISYTNVDLDILEYGKTIVGSLKDKYELTSEQAMRYEMYGDALEVYEFSDFVNELYELDSDITYTASGVGGYGDEDFSTMKYLFTFYKDGDYIGYKGIEFTTRFNIEIGEVASEEEFIEILREEVIDTYKKITTPQTFRMLRSRSLYTSNIEEDIDVTIEKVLDEQLLKPVYNITVEDLTFTAVVTANVRGEKNYTYSVTNIKVDRELYNLKVNDKVTVKYEITPDNATNKEVEWKSSNKNVAIVKNGVITAVGAGKAIITISSKDGNCTKDIEVYVTNIIKDDDPVKETIKTGDVNGDNKIDMTDMITLRKYFAGLTNISEKNILNADINKDGKVDMTDIIKLRKYFAGLENL